MTVHDVLSGIEVDENGDLVQGHHRVQAAREHGIDLLASARFKAYYARLADEAEKSGNDFMRVYATMCLSPGAPIVCRKPSPTQFVIADTKVQGFVVDGPFRTEREAEALRAGIWADKPDCAVRLWQWGDF